MKFGKKFISIPTGKSPTTITLEDAISLIEDKIKADAPIHVYEGKDVQKGKEGLDLILSGIICSLM